MFRVFCKRNLIWGGLFSMVSVDEKKLEDYQKVRGVHLQSGWERVKIIFQEDSMGSFHPDLQKSIDMAEFGIYTGGLWGAYIGSRESMERFQNNNDASLFHSNKDALRQMSRKSLLGGALGILKTAPVFAAFTGGFTLFTSCVQAYRLKEGIIEYCIGGFLIGSLFRFHYGVKGMIVGGVIASFLGGIYGTVELGVSKLMGKNPIELKFLLASYRREVADSMTSTYYASGQKPSITVTKSAPNSSHSSGENQKN